MTDRRPSATRRGYGETWRRYRRWHLKLHPLCTHCGKPVSEVDHITPLSDGGTHLDPGNSQPLCKSRKTQAERHGGTPRPGCDVNGAPVLP